MDKIVSAADIRPRSPKQLRHGIMMALLLCVAGGPVGGSYVDWPDTTSIVGVDVGAGVGVELGAGVGETVGAGVGVELGAGVGETVGAGVGASSAPEATPNTSSDGRNTSLKLQPFFYFPPGASCCGHGGNFRNDGRRRDLARPVRLLRTIRNTQPRSPHASFHRCAAATMCR